MFGYVRPERGELKVREYELFRAAYCGLCHTLGRRYGFRWRFLLNYDFCYLVILHHAAENTPCTCCPRRCIASPSRKRQTLAEDEALDYAADATVLLSWYRVQDSCQDEQGWKRWLWKAIRCFMRRGYRRAKRLRPQLDAVFAENMAGLRVLEAQGMPSVDRPADAFAKMLAAASGEGEGTETRILREILYHTGRWIYIADAWDDVSEDLEKGEYNPIVNRYQLKDMPTGETAERLRETLELSCAAAARAAEFLTENDFTAIVRNVIYLGMPSVARAIRDGTYHRQESHRGCGLSAFSGRNTKHGSL